MHKDFCKILLPLPVALLLTGCGGKPDMEVPASLTTIGQATQVSVHIRSVYGVRELKATLSQNGARYEVWQLPSPSGDKDATFTFAAGSRSTPQLQDGPATLILDAKSGGSFSGTAHWARAVTVDTKPPSVSADAEQHYLYRGMSDIATLNVSGSYTSAGVRVGDQSFRAWPMPGGKPGFFSLFAFAWNMPLDTTPVVFAANAAGNDVTTPLTVVFPKREQPVYTQHQIQVTEQFMQKVLGELDPNGSGSPVERFKKINTEMRRANNKTLADLRFKTADHFLWTQTFMRQEHSAAEATFADVRSYIYKGVKIDEQVHLGYDLAVTQHVRVQASNDGVILYAAPLGIYGNCVVVDHGYGLQTIYGHMSQFQVHVGDTVKRGQVMGLSGMTGMAGGDHIHFAMQLDGVQIDAKEWWDPHWIRDHVSRRIDLSSS